MILNLLLDNIKQAYKDDIYVIVLFIGIIVMLDYTLGRKYSLKKTIFGWIGIIFSFYGLSKLLYIGQYELIHSFKPFFSENSILYSFFYGFGIWMYFIQLTLLVIGSRWLYKGTVSLHIFISSVLYLFVSMISDYCMPLLLVVFNPTVSSSGYYINFEIGGGPFYPAIGVAFAVILYILYRYVIGKKVSVISSMPEKRMKKLNFIPIVAYIAYSFMYLLMNYVDVYASSPSRLIYFVLIFATIITIYSTMFVAFFYGVISTIDFTKIETQIKVAAEIQRNNLPNDFRDLSDDGSIDLAVSIKPASECCGDFYDYFFINDRILAVVIADVSGKGVSASLIMMKTKVLIEDNALYSDNPAMILTKVNSQLAKGNKNKNFVTVFLGILDIKTGSFVYSNAGHNYPIIKKAQGNFEEFKTKNGLVLGGMKSSKYWNEEIKLNKGDRVFLYTDGVNEAFNKKGDMFGVPRLLYVINMVNEKTATMSDLINEINLELDHFTNREQQSDDITMLAFEYTGLQETHEVVVRPAWAQ